MHSDNNKQQFSEQERKNWSKKMLPVNKNQQPPRQQSPSALSAKFKECL